MRNDESLARRLMNSRRRKFGFTLIELLIVVAIIAILAAIAVPNFLEAQTRSKVSRAYADMRSMATALEAYAVDFNKYPLTAGLRKSSSLIEYPPTVVSGDQYNNIWAGACLTTPCAYITSLPQDVFMLQQNRPELRYFMYRDFRYMRQLSGGTLGAGPAAHNAAFGEWFFLGAGPDMDRLDISGQTQPVTRMYDPTNGTISNGDMVICQKTGVFK